MLIKNGRVIDPESGFDGLADLLIENGKIKKIVKRIDGGADNTVPERVNGADEVLDALLSCGAFPALAHPFQYKLGDKGTMELAAYLASLGMKGLEVYHSSNNRLESMKLQEIAAACRLLPTGGSDFHGSNKPDISIGRGRGGLRVSCLLLEDIKKAL